ncbi:MAG: sigma-70 family RNA polymerase sigma factor [Sphingomonadales bacterium]|nr:sigma-70 family RNA polymerase sigma factor [Sphingomonadales bacterium]
MSANPSRVVDLLPALTRYARRLTRDDDEAADLVQEALVSAYANANQYQPGRSLRIWIFAILHNAFVSRVRHDAVRKRYGAEAETPVALPSPQEQSVRLREVAEALDLLPPDQQQVLHLVAVEGLSYQEAADAIGVPIGTLVSRLSRARARLRAIESGDADDHAHLPLRIVEN